MVGWQLFRGCGDVCVGDGGGGGVVGGGDSRQTNDSSSQCLF